METFERKQFVYPAVTKTKFSRELQEFKENEAEFRKKGIICLKMEELSIELLFGVPHLTPTAVAFAVVINYTNWDIEPPSITFIDPFSSRFLQRNEIKVNLWQIPDITAVRIVNNMLVGVLDLLQPAGGDNAYPFLCIPGVREYHQHYAHSGDPWMLHRTKGEGKLCVLIDQLFRHSIPFVSGFKVEAQFNVAINGLSQDLNKAQ